MKSFTIALFFLLVVNHSRAQDSIAHLSTAMFDKNQVIELSNRNEWSFHAGNSPAWKSPGASASGWVKMKPADVSKKLADKNGKIEGWFRLTIWLDSSFDKIPIYFDTDIWGAADTYIDGNLFYSIGNTGVNGKAFNAPDRVHKLEMNPIHLTPGKAHTLTIHFINYIPAFPLNLITQDGFCTPYPLLSGPVLIPKMNAYYEKSAMYQTVLITVCVVLSLLFWLLAFQNPGEGNLWLIALSPTFISVAQLLGYFQNNSKLSLVDFVTINALQQLFSNLVLVLTPLIIAKIFLNKIPRKLIVLLGIISIIFYYVRFTNAIIPIFIIVSMVMSISVYYVISSWKIIKGANWAIAVGVLITLFWVLIFVIIRWIQLTPLNDAELILFTLMYISIPISLLVYTSMRFREVIAEVRENARQVMQVTDEKRQQALNQQIVLEQEVKRQTADLTETLNNLKSTQVQLIQSEKMASLGELTAGIAHEIQNPLNFVNNFSEINNELADEINGENDIEEIRAIAHDIKQNSEKILFHGKRADAIVKGMLQHSRKTQGIKEPTDINALCDEYLRLSYHGLRAKDKNFNADFKTDFNESIGKINIVPQDIGRVLLNLFNNAFYAVSEKQKSESLSQNAEFKPAVSIQTNKINNKVQIVVKDNGNGIPSKIIDKIFQPFFTTKPTGQGTGLGLSLSYDIIKALGGELKVETEEGVGTKFIIQLP